jgi:hypothetical protein
MHSARYVFGIALSLALHWLFLQPFLLGSRSAQRLIKQSGPGASAAASDSGEYMTLVIINIIGKTESSVPEDFASRGTAELDLLVQVASSDPAPLLAPLEIEEDEPSEELAAHTAGDPAMQSLLFGRYSAQIDARIRRAWRKPRSPIHEPEVGMDVSGRQADVFHCQARISQDAFGHVTEIELLDCDGASAWQLSLVRAIQRASPLPAPPNPTVFTNALTLSFEGRAYQPGVREDEYESKPIAGFRQSATSSDPRRD